jgi:hypothetical protein
MSSAPCACGVLAVCRPLREESWGGQAAGQPRVGARPQKMMGCMRFRFSCAARRRPLSRFFSRTGTRSKSKKAGLARARRPRKPSGGAKPDRAAST